MQLRLNGELSVGRSRMNELNHQDVPPSAEQVGYVAWMPIVLCLLVVAAVFYMGGLVGFFRWEERAATKAEYIRRAQIRNRIYAPVIWLKTLCPKLPPALPRTEIPLRCRIRQKNLQIFDEDFPKFRRPICGTGFARGAGLGKLGVDEGRVFISGGGLFGYPPILG